MKLFVLFISFFLFTLRVSAANSFQTTVTVTKPNVFKPISPLIWGMQLLPPVFLTAIPTKQIKAGDPILTADDYLTYFIGLDKLNPLGIKAIRYPNGCMADAYDWKTSRLKYSNNGNTFDRQVMNIDQVLILASKLKADLIYTVNIETLGLINPCGDTTLYKGTLQDAIDLVTKYKGKITYYELGNESWGYWDPAKYTETAIQFATAMKLIDPSIKISIQGYPSTGNNQDPTTPAGIKSLNWNTQIKQALTKTCSGVPCFDYVTDHPYVNSGFDQFMDLYAPTPSNFAGLAAFYPLANYPTIFNQLNSTFSSAKIDISEWNLKCWGPTHKTNKNLLTNPSFEPAMSNWTYFSQNSKNTQAEVSAAFASVGTNSLKLTLEPISSQPDSINQVSQSITVRPNTKIEAFADIRTNSPKNVRLIIQQANPGPHQWHHVGEISLQNKPAHSWQKLTITGRSFEDTTQVQIVLRNVKSPSEWVTDPTPVTTYFDAIYAMAEPPFGYSNQAVDTAEHGLFILESMLLMAQNTVHANIFFQLQKNGANCSILNKNNAINAPAQAFTFTGALAGNNLIQTSVTGSPIKRVPGDPLCVNSDCIKTDKDVPFVSAYTSVSPDGTLNIIAINRHDSQGADVLMDISSLNFIKAGNTSMRYLTAPMYTTELFTEREESITIPVSKKFNVTIPPVSAVRIQAPGNRSTDPQLIIGSSSSVHILTAGKKYPIPNPEILQHFGYQFSDVFQVSDMKLQSYPSGPTITRALKGTTSTVYLIENGKKRPIPNWDTFISLGFTVNDRLEMPDAFINSIPLGSPVPSTAIVDGTTVQGTTASIYLISGGKKYGFPNVETFNHFGFQFHNVIKVTDSKLNTYPNGPTLTRVIKGSSAAAYLMENGKKRLIPNWNTFLSLGYKQSDLIELTDTTLLKFPSGVIVPSVISPTVIPQIVLGDINNDMHVNQADFDIIKLGYGTKYSAFDYNNLVTNFGK